MSGRNSDLKGAFYPNQIIQRTEQGDLAPYSNLAVNRPVFWQTDEFGFRNRKTSCESYPVVIVGDSFTVGTGLTQGDSLSEVLSRQLNVCVYSFATVELNDYIESEHWRRFRPKLVIYAKSERWLFSDLTLPGEFRKLYSPQLGSVAEYPLLETLAVIRDRFGKKILLRAFQNRGPIFVGSRMMRWALGLPYDSSSDRHSHDRAPAIQFLVDEDKSQLFSDANVQILGQRISAFRDWFAAQHVSFMFVPLPNKGTIYLEKLENRAKPLTRVYKEMISRQIPTSDVLNKFLQHKETSKALLYQSDDSHWNELGVSLAADLIAEEIRQSQVNL